MEDVAYSGSPSSFSPAFAGSISLLNSGVLYIASDSANTASGVAKENVVTKTTPFLPMASQSSNYKKWNLATAHLVTAGVGSGNFDLTTIPQWSQIAGESPTHVVARAYATYSTERASGGLDNNRYGIRINAGGVIVADASFLQSAGGSDADDSAIIVDSGEMVVPILPSGTEMFYNITQDLNGLEGDLADNQIFLWVAGFERAETLT